MATDLETYMQRERVRKAKLEIAALLYGSNCDLEDQAEALAYFIDHESGGMIEMTSDQAAECLLAGVAAFMATHYDLKADMAREKYCHIMGEG